MILTSVGSTARPLQRFAVFLRTASIVSLNREPWSETRQIVVTVPLASTPIFHFA